MHYADLEDESMMEKWVSGGEQSGKSYSASKELAGRILEGQIFWICGSDYENCDREFDYFLRDMQTLQWVVNYSRPQKGQLRCELLGDIKVKTVSLQDLDKVGKESPNGVLIVEAAQILESAIDRLRTRVIASGGWLHFSGTLEGSRTWFADLIEEYESSNTYHAKTFYMPSWSNLFNYPGGRDDPKIRDAENKLPEDVFLERLAGKRVKPSRLIMKEFDNKIHVGDHTFNPELDVEITIDPGGAFKSGAYAVEALQQYPDYLVLVDEIYIRGLVTEEIIEIAINKHWWKNVRGGTIDIAAKQHSTAGHITNIAGRQVQISCDWDIWYSKTGIPLRCGKIEEAGGIDRLKSALKVDQSTRKPHLLVNHTAKGFISECGAGRSPVFDGGAWLRHEHTGKPIDKNNHACKALYYYLVDKLGYVNIDSRELVGVTNYSPFTE